MNKPAKIIASIAIAASVGAGIGACSSSGSSTPPNATQVLQSDGYTPLSNNLIPSGNLGQISQYASSFAWGDDSGGNVEAVAVILPQYQSAVQSSLSSANLPAGVTDSYNNGVLRLDGSEAAFGG